ncbi:MAG: hypothetical protein C4547_12895 [Phycisphaerales bacterium]|nr:MAG: hypothetical protein C4547_12895 [Phycisphaerales bacterium]
MMLENIMGTKGLPSADLIRDLRTLCSLDPSEIASIADVIADLPEQLEAEDVSDEGLSRLALLKTDPEQLNRAVKAALFLLQRWSDRDFTKDQVLSDLAGLRLSSDQVGAVQPLLSAMEKKRAPIARQRAEAHALGTGTPRIDSALCVVDARAVFQSTRHDKLKGDDQQYFRLDRFVPIAILEIVAELNDEKTTQSYLLTEETLEQLCQVLDRARRRILVVKKHLDLPEGQCGG